MIVLGTSSSLNFAPSASTLTLQIFAYGVGWQRGNDVAWTIDKLSVALSGGVTWGVPEPFTWATVILGMGGIGYSLRCRRATIAFA